MALSLSRALSHSFSQEIRALAHRGGKRGSLAERAERTLEEPDVDACDVEAVVAREHAQRLALDKLLDADHALKLR